MTLIKLKDLEAHLWHTAHIITGPIDASVRNDDMAVVLCHGVCLEAV